MNKFYFILIIMFLSLILSPTISSAGIKSREEYEKTGHVFWEFNINKRLVAITFDDGPHPVFTPQILDLLAKYNAKATFFVTGKKVEMYPNIIIRQLKEGHEIGNHTFHHFSKNTISSFKLSLELDKTNNIFKKLTGKRMNLYRPVQGVYNDVIINTATKKGYDVIMWSWDQDPKDWRNPSSIQIANHIIKNITPGDIILLHDWGNLNKSQTVQALESVLKYLKENNYKCVTISELMYHSARPLPKLLDQFQ